MNAKELHTFVVVELSSPVLQLTLGEYTTQIGDLFWNGVSICRADAITLGQYRKIVSIS